MRQESEEKRIARESLYQSYKESGLSMTAYSRERGVPFWKVRGAIKRSEAATEHSFSEVVLPVGSRSTEYTAVLHNGRELRIPGGFSVEQVRALVEVLER